MSYRRASVHLAIGHIRSAIYCLYDLGVYRDVNTYDIISQ